MKPVKILFPILITAVMVFLSTIPLQASLKIGFEFAGQQNIVDKASLVSQKGSLLGFSLGLVGGGESIHPELLLVYCQRKAEQIGFGLGDIVEGGIYIGGSYGLESSPMFWIDNMGVQITFSALGGWSSLFFEDFWGVEKISALLSGGLSIIPANSRSRVLIEFVYRPISMEMEMRTLGDNIVGTLLIKPSWSIRTSFIF